MDSLLLALETSGRAGSVALLKAPVALSALSASPSTLTSIVDSIELDHRWGSAKTLAPAIDQLLKRQSLTPKDLDGIAVVQGPGSFTGLRVGIATAKLMAYALEIPIVAVNTLDVIATDLLSHQQQVTPSEGNILYAVIDAFRGQSFFARYHFAGTAWVAGSGTEIADNDILAQRIFDELTSNSHASTAIFIAGPSISKLQQAISQHPRATEFSQTLRMVTIEPTAQTVALLSLAEFASGNIQAPFALLPKYYRSSAAEENRAPSKR